MNNDANASIAGFDAALKTANDLRSSLEKVIRGRRDTINLVIAALLADGHVLLEDYPGSGKTLLTKTLGRLIAKDGQESAAESIAPFRRIQFTPDMLPGDVLGVNIFEPGTGTFRFIHGPVFAHIVLADEINRTGPKVQAAFLECMAEKQVTIDSTTHRLDPLFFVVGTQNPLDFAGTYPLPLVQLDRFLLKIPMSYVDAGTEMEILAQHSSIVDSAATLDPVCTRSDILHARSAVNTVHVKESVRRAIVEIVQSTRQHPLLQYGASTRSAIMLQQGVKSWALVQGRDYVTEDDIKFLAPFVLMHRLKFHSNVNDPKKAIQQIIEEPMEKLIRSTL